jgi:hypothetical protein
MFALILVCFLAPATNGGNLQSMRSIRCDRDIVRLGAPKFEVLAECGRPSSTFLQQKEVLLEEPIDPYRRNIVQIEYWLYNYGPRRFFIVYQFEDGRLTAILEGGYGYDAPTPEFCKVGKDKVRAGDLVPIVEMVCGSPWFEETRYEDRVVVHERTKEERVVTVRVDEWTYNFGSRDFTTTLIFEDGVLVALRQGGYGYD